MILARLEDATGQLGDQTRLRQAMEFLVSTQDRQLEDGRIDIAGAAVFALVQTYESRAFDTPTFEAHRKYIDIQYVISGSELMGWAPLSAVKVTTPYDNTKDVLLGAVPGPQRILLPFSAGTAAVLYPEDAHAPGLAADGPAPVRKIVVKVAVE